ncbi:U3 small nucleolar RNA-associated protein 4 homolog [Neodiprion fabricii]|uniref:U3 small nucleolar RNA-associated protein 4 homolog n=1 Tax=Neodiprion fabricii TaxID=2872261 RepID=UPI001ED915D9|nr:U3 small nucleolar RNA-associated protein 4 homolog [Neodiprion fabricii]
MSTCKIHNFKLYNLEPKAIICLCYEPKHGHLVLCRSDNSIEIWNVKEAPFLERTIFGHPESSVETVLWVSNRLFSTGLVGMVIEYDLGSLAPKYEVAVTGGAAWCMDVNKSKTQIAVGTEDGYINTFNVTDDYLIYDKIFDKQEGRILCIKWDITEQMIFTGSIDTVRIWNAVSGHAVHRMTTSRKEANKETIVWCLAVTNDNVVVSGDSRGILSFWDPNMGTLIESHQSHTADILAVAMSSDMNTVYCAGVDPTVCTYSKITIKSSGRWVKGIERRLHEHDVRALVESNGKLYSAGVDGHLVQSTYPPKTMIKYPPILQSPCVLISEMSRCILLRYSNYLELWKLGSISRKSQQNFQPGTIHQLEEEPINLLQLRTKASESIISYAITKDSKMIAYSTNSYIRIFNFDVVNNDPVLSRYETSNLPVHKAHKMLFSPDNSRIVLVDGSKTDNDEIKIIFMKNQAGSLNYEGTIPVGKELVDNINLICFSPDGVYLICADYQNNIAIYHVGKDLNIRAPKLWLLPRYKCPPTAMAVQENTLNLVIVYSDHKIVEYSITEKRYTQFSTNLEEKLPKQWLSRAIPISHITFDPRNENLIIMHDNTMICVVDKAKNLPNSGAKIFRLDNGDSMDNSNHETNSHSQGAFRIVKKYKNLVHLGWLVNDEMVAVELNPVKLTENLPPSLKQKRFGM